MSIPLTFFHKHLEVTGIIRVFLLMHEKCDNTTKYSSAFQWEPCSKRIFMMRFLGIFVMHVNWKIHMGCKFLNIKTMAINMPLFF